MSLETREQPARQLALRRTALLMATLMACSFAPLAAQSPNGSSSAQSQPKPKAERLWSPPNVDARLASLSTAQTCSLPDVLAHTGARAQDIVDNLQRFAANEIVQYDQFDSFGMLKVSETASYDYGVSFQQRSGGFSVDETRNVSAGGKGLSGGPPDRGLPSLALIFHPYYQGDYDMKCEGTADWNGTPAWVIHFVQRKDKPSRTRAIDTPQGEISLRLKGRAWIAQDSYQVLHIETNLVEPIPFLGLSADAVSISYAPVDFHSQDTQLWLPQSAETFTQSANRRVVVTHTFANFLLFSVQTNQTVDKPRQP